MKSTGQIKFPSLFTLAASGFELGIHCSSQISSWNMMILRIIDPRDEPSELAHKYSITLFD